MPRTRAKRSTDSAAAQERATDRARSSSSERAVETGSTTAPDTTTPDRSAAPADKTTPVGTVSDKDKAKICPLLADLIEVGSNPPVIPRSTMWKPGELAKWYAECAWLSFLLTAALGAENPWKSTLTGGNPKVDDPQFQLNMLRTLEVIQMAIGCEK